MKIGLNLPVMVPGFDRDKTLTWARRLDAGPFSSLAAGERITFPNPDILVTLSACAAVTERVRLVFSILVLPMHQPVRVAKQIATLDVLSGGRVTLGVGVGGRDEDYVAVEAQRDRKLWTRMEESVSELRRLWSGEKPFEAALRPVEPLPIQKGGPEILIGGGTPQAIARAGRLADGFLAAGTQPEAVESSYKMAVDAWEAAGKSGKPRLAAVASYALGPNAADVVGGYIRHYYSFLGPVAEQMAQNAVSSTEAVTGMIRDLEGIGMDELVFLPTAAEMGQLDRLADIVG